MNKIKTLFKRLLGHFPSKLPIGVTAYEVWAKDILETYDFMDNVSTRFALANMIMHLPSTQASKPKVFFAQCLHKAAANQVAYHFVLDFKKMQEESIAKDQAEKNAAAAKEATDKAIKEATASNGGASNASN